MKELNEENLKKFSKKFRVNDVTRFFGITPRILKHYEETGVLNPERTDNNAYREYSAEDVIKIQLAERLKSTQFSQREIAEYFSGGLDIEKKHAELISLKKIIDDILDVLEVDLRNGEPQFSIQEEQTLLCFCKTYPSTNDNLKQYIAARDAYMSAISAGCVCDVTNTFFKQYDNLVTFPRVDNFKGEFGNQTYRICVPILSAPKNKDFDGTVETVTRKKSLVMKFALAGAPFNGGNVLKEDKKYRGGGFYLQEEAKRRGLSLTGKAWMESTTGPNKKTANRTYTALIAAEIE